MIRFALCARGDGAAPLGVSCDEDGVFLAGDVPLVVKSFDEDGGTVYSCRPAPEINFFLNAYGSDVDFSDRIAPLRSIARHMNNGKWVVAKIATVHLRLPDLIDDRARVKLLRADAQLTLVGLADCPCGRSIGSRQNMGKRDVSDEPRVPRGQTGGGEWEGGGGGDALTAKPLLVPAQAVPMPMPLPFELPFPPTEITPFPFEIPNGNIREPIPVNPYPDRPDCVAEWAHAAEFCSRQQRQGKLKPGYSGFGKDLTRCILGMVSEACGGNAMGA